MVMKGVLEHQKMWSLVVAIALAVLITVFAAFNSFGETSNDDLNDEERVEMEILERAYADVQEEPIIVVAEEIQKIKIFDAQNKLVAETALAKGDVIEEESLKVLLNKADLLVKSGSIAIYRIAE
ncbi:MAG: hypothetical protein COW03_08745 [Cytophagales bacterium CG12_big_fil_rev_8_21_14_0_65_40_12]|nr:MAG: hypothetical protein COW03_08745 [Cytophagales bacterium CG12_big_fil_rev_8_21_14_0_65_40_12]PIW05504.1 MAG: hypothetical protein COW40_04435 [Cytophagales bacterium CG17_big_fil_post_rev_8_21_14_2_50_40_13]